VTLPPGGVGDTPENARNGRVVVIADVADFDGTITSQSDFLEMTDEYQLEAIKRSVIQMGLEVVIYSNPSDFTKHISQHADDFVVTLWSGRHSRNRRAIVPAICEGNNIRYLGADPYAALVCQDKSLSKRLTERFGMRTPEHVVFNGQFNADDLNILKYPLVVKPAFEGGSIGISSRNLVESAQDAIDLAKYLFATFDQPILIEEFIYGSEVSICIAGTAGDIRLMEAIEVCYDDRPNYLFDKLYSFEEKRFPERTTHRQQLNVTHRIPEEILEMSRRLFVAMGKLDIFRIDGRLNANDFTVIELTPDVGLSPSGIFASAFGSMGLDYESMICTVINMARGLDRS
jgi:D-alanine-D-alanine ligase